MTAPDRPRRCRSSCFGRADPTRLGLNVPTKFTTVLRGFADERTDLSDVARDALERDLSLTREA